MAKPSPANPLGYIIKREYTDRFSFTKSLLRERLCSARSLYRKDLLAHYGCVNAIEFSNKGDLLVSGGDDRRVLIWNVEQAVQGIGKPIAMRAQHISNIFCLGFDSTTKRVFSAGNDDQVIVHDAVTGDPIDYFLHEQPVYGLSIDPMNDNVFASACDDGRVLLYDIREPTIGEPFCLASYMSSFHAVMFNPLEPRILTTANSKEGVGLWDVRKPRQILMKYGHKNVSQSCMSVRFNQSGTHILALRRRLPPVLYAVHSPDHKFQFDHPGYYNSCTMKSCCFAGEDDQYVLSGSDDFGLYVWKIPASEEDDQWVDTAHMILQGHRSIVNQVRFNSSSYIIASSGVEKLIKFWSPFALPESSGSLIKDCEPTDSQRKVFTHEEYISLVLRSGEFMTHDYSHQSTKEDPRMMAFFDSLVQREIEGWTTDESAESTDMSVTVAESASDFESALSDTPVTALTAALVEALEGQRSNGPSESQGEVSETQSTETCQSQNRISQLIAKKRAQLIRLARTRNGEDETVCTPRKRKSHTLDDSSDSSDSGREMTISTEENVSFKNGNMAHKKSSDSEYENGKASSSSSSSSCSSKSKYFDIIKNCDIQKRRMKCLIAYSDSSDEEEWNITQKRKRKMSYHSDSDSDVEDCAEENSLSSARNLVHQTSKFFRKCVDKDSDSDVSTSDSGSDYQRHQMCTRAKRKLLLVRSKRVESSSNGDRVNTKPKGKKHKKKNTNSSSIEVQNLTTEQVDLPELCKEKVETMKQKSMLKDDVNSEHVCEIQAPVTPNGKSCSGSSINELETPDSGIASIGSPYSRPNSNTSQSSHSSASPQSKGSDVQLCSSALSHPNGSSHCSQTESSNSYANGSRSQSCTQPVSSTSRFPLQIGSNDSQSNSEWSVFQRYKIRANRMQRNFRKHVSDDSDSN